MPTFFVFFIQDTSFLPLLLSNCPCPLALDVLLISSMQLEFYYPIRSVEYCPEEDHLFHFP